MKLVPISTTWRKLVDLFKRWTTPIGIAREEGLRYWQERIVSTILLISLILGLAAYIPSVRLCFKEHLWGVAVFDTIIYSLVFVLLFFRRIPFVVRAYIIIFAIFALGIVLLSVVGPSASGPVWLFAFPVMAGVIMGFRMSIFAVFINVVTLIITGILLYQGYPAWQHPAVHTVERWITISFNFVLLNALAAFSVSMILRGLQFSLNEEKSVRASLERRIQEKIEAEKALRESESRYKALFQGAAEGIIIMDHASMQFIYVNQAVCAMTGYAESELTRKSFRDLTADQEGSGLWTNWQDFEDQPNRRMTDFPLKRRDGSTIYADVSNTKIMIDNKECVASFFTDVTERKIKEKEKKELQQHLQRAQKMEAIGTFAGGIAHDFNNILAVIIGFSELSMDENEDSAVIRQNLREVLHSAYRASDLIHQILAFSRKSDVSLKPISVEPIVKEALKMLRAMLPSSIAISQRISSRFSIIGDPTNIHQILMNLCVNAEHAMAEHGGVLDVQLSDVDLDAESAKFHPDLHPGLYVLLSVADTGVGIPPDMLAKIFDPFFTTKEPGKGTGLGLSVIHGIVRNYDGAIDVKSDPGKGSVFKVYLPATAVHSLEEAPADINELPSGSERILLVDDEPGIVNMIKKSLERLGYKVSEFTGSRQALDKFKAAPGDFDLVITDMTMPDMTGDELSAEVMRTRADIPVIVCTGFSHRMSEEQAVQMGIKAFLQKPIRREELVQVVRRVLDGI